MHHGILRQVIYIYFNKLKLTRYVKGLLGEDENIKSYSAKDYKWTPLEKGYIAYRVNQAYFVKVKTIMNVENNRLSIETKTDRVIPINLILVTNDLYISDVYSCNNPNKIVLVLSSDLGESTFITWSLTENQEVHNYSIKGKFTYISGLSSEAGYILNNNRYINLDTGLPNYFFNHNFAELDENLRNGYKINRDGKSDD